MWISVGGRKELFTILNFYYVSLKCVHRLSGIIHMAPLSGLDAYQVKVGLSSDF